MLVAPARARLLAFAVVGDDMADAGTGEDPARLRDLTAFNQNAPRQGPDRAFKHAHIEVGQHKIDALLLQQGADIGQ